MQFKKALSFSCLMFLSLFFSGCSFGDKEKLPSGKISKSEKIDSQYYEGIIEYKCKNLTGSKKQCCLESVSDMKSVNARDTDYTVDWVTGEKCQTGSTETRRNCDGSLSWCIPNSDSGQGKNQVSVSDCKSDKNCLLEKAKKCEGATGSSIYEDGENYFSVNHEIIGKNAEGKCMYSGRVGTVGGDKYVQALGTTIECATGGDKLSKVFENGGFEKGIIENCSGSFVNFMKPYYNSF